MDAAAERFTFYYVGRVDGAYAFRAPTYPTSGRRSLDALRFEGCVSNWLIVSLPTTPDQPARWHLGNGSAAGYPELPFAFRTGRSLGLLLRSLSDVLFFEQNFRVAGLTPEIAQAA